MNRIIRSIAVLGVGILALTGCGLQPATAYVPRVSPGSITPFGPAARRLTDHHV